MSRHYPLSVESKYQRPTRRKYNILLFSSPKNEPMQRESQEISSDWVAMVVMVGLHFTKLENFTSTEILSPLIHYCVVWKTNLSCSTNNFTELDWVQNKLSTLSTKEKAVHLPRLELRTCYVWDSRDNHSLQVQ